jgi:hypothetical protein
MRGRLAAAEQVRYSAGGFAQKKKEGPVSHSIVLLQEHLEILQ